LNWIKEIIDKLLENYKTNEPIELAEALNINVTYELLVDMQGYYLNSGKFKFIVVNSNLDYYDKRVVIAHELGHALLHPNLNTSFLTSGTFASIDKYERQANEFAAHLLLPDGFEKDIEFKNKTVEQIARMVGLPVELVNLKLKNNVIY